MQQTVITQSSEAFSILQNEYNPFAEEFWCICLNHKLELLAKVMIHRGTLNFCHIHPRDLFRVAIHNNTFRIIIAHNHVSKNLIPSESDLLVTKKLLKLSKLLEVEIVDHIIFDDLKYFSFKDHKIIFK